MQLQVSFRLAASALISRVGEKRTSMSETKGKQGFASMTPEKKRDIASKGGKSAHALGVAHQWTSEEAQAAGRKGGTLSRRGRK